MWYFTSQMNAATASVNQFNEATSAMQAPSTYAGRNILRKGEEDIYAKGD
jgi:hypothetical protein